MVTVTSLPFWSSTLSPSASAYFRPSWKMWPISMPRASCSGPDPSGAGSPARISAASIMPSGVKSRPQVRSKTCRPGSFAPVSHRVPATTRGSTR